MRKKFFINKQFKKLHLHYKNDVIKNFKFALIVDVNIKK